MMRTVLLILTLSGCSGMALNFDTESDSFRAEDPPSPFATTGPRLEL
ncbi:hypothetical protein [Yoonia sp. 208BN28-4]